MSGNEDKSKDPKYKRSEAERGTHWSGPKIVNAEKSGQFTKVRKNPRMIWLENLGDNVNFLNLVDAHLLLAALLNSITKNMLMKRILENSSS